MFGNPGGRRSEVVVLDVRKRWCANAICKGCKCHLRGLQMAFATHHFRTTATTLFEQRQPPHQHNGNHPFRTTLLDMGGGDLPQRANGRGESHSPHKNDSNNALGFRADAICHNGQMVGANRIRPTKMIRTTHLGL